MLNVEEQLQLRGVGELLEAEEAISGTTRLADEIGDGAARELSQYIGYACRRGIKEITLIITSPGGGAYAAFAIYDAIRAAEAAGIPTKGVVEGYAASAASMIVLQACKRRLAMAHSRLHLHEVSQWIFMEKQKMSDVEDSAKEMKVLTDMMAEILSKRTGKTKEEIEEFIKRRERWMSAQEAKEFGLIDEVI
jgi:ATP-dependent Clp protease protease subunit